MPNSPRPRGVRPSAEQVNAAIHAFLRLRLGGELTAVEQKELARLQRLYVEAVRAEDVVRAA